MNAVYIGLDVHQKQSFYCALSREGEKLGHEKIPTERASLERLVGHYAAEGPVMVALEAGGSSWWVTHVLRASGAAVHVVNTHELKLIAHSKRKTDKYDSKVLADLLRCAALPEPVYQPSAWAMQLRCQMKVRKWLVRQHAQAIVRAKSLMRHLGVSVTARMFHSARSWEEVLAMMPGYEGLLRPMYEVWQLTGQQIKSAEAVVREMLPESDPRMELLRSIPGIGLVTAWTLIAVVEDIRRFQRADQLVSYAGLVPAERSSGDRCQTGSITKRGRSELRDVLIQAAWSALRTPDARAGHLKTFFYRIMHRRCSQVAIVALAKKLAVISYHVWKQGIPFAADRSEARAA